MIEQFIQGRTSVFVDASNIYHSENSLGFRVDYQKLLFYFQKAVDLKAIHYYAARVTTDQGQKMFFDKLDMLGYKVRKKEVKKIRDRETQNIIYKGNFDVELTIDAIDTLSQYDNFVLLSGDSDFAELLVYLKSKDKKVIVMSTKEHIAKKLLNEAKYIDLKKLMNEIKFSHKKYPRYV